jgi:hypothetical protein
MAFNDTYRESIQSKHIANVGFTSTAKGVTNEGFGLVNPHQVIASQIPAVDVVGTYGPLTADGVSAGVVQEHSLVTLTEDTTVNDKKAWYAEVGGERVTQMMRYAGTQYKLRLFANDGTTEILPSETNFNWEYDASVGVVYFDSDPSAHYTTPLKATFYTYIGETVEDKLGTSVSGVEVITDIWNDTQEPSGFVNRTDSTVTFDEGTRTLTISGSDYRYYILGEQYNKSGAESIQITDTEGMHYIYYDGDTLTHTTSFDYNLIYNKAYISAIYWNATDDSVVYHGDERHGITMDGQTHAYLHITLGTSYVDGLALTDIVADGDGSSAAHAQLGVASGSIRDEDLLHSIDTLSAPASIPVFYKEGASGNWRKSTATAYPVKSFTGGSSLLAWNEDDSGTWKQTEVADGGFVLTHIFATNDVDNGVIAIQGQAAYSNVTDARNGASEEINSLVTAGMPFAEFTPIGTIIFQTNATYSNAVKARVVSNDLGDSWSDFRFSGYSPNPDSVTSHANLTGRDLASSHPASAIEADYTNFDGKLSSSDDDVQKALDTLDDHTHTFIELTDTPFDYGRDEGVIPYASMTSSGILYSSSLIFNDSTFTLETQNIDATGNVSISGTLGFDEGTTIDEFITTVTSGVTDDQVATAKAIYDYVEAKPQTFIDLTDTIDTFTEGRILFESSDSVVDDGSLTYVSGTQTFSAPNIDITTDLTVGGTSTVDGDSTVGGNSTVGGDLTVSGSADVTTNFTVGGTADVTGNATFAGDVAISGTLGFDTGTTINEFVTTVDGSSTDDQVATAGAVYEYVEATSSGLTDDIVWEVVNTPWTQIRPKVEHQGKAIYTYGNLTIGGDLTVSGTTTTVHSEELTVADKIITVNAGEAGAGITGERYAGIEVDRGSEQDYYFVFDEVQDNFRVGISGSLQAVATREDTPTNGYVAIWNSSEVRFDTSASIALDDLATDAELSAVSGTLQSDIDDNAAWIAAHTSSDHSHNSLSGLQGGTTNEFYHLTNNEYSQFSAADGTTFTFGGSTAFQVTGTFALSNTTQTVNNITTDVDVDSTNDELPTAAAVWTAIDSKPNDFIGLTDTPGTYTAERILYTTASGVTWSDDLTWDGTTLTLTGNMTVDDIWANDIDADGNITVTGTIGAGGNISTDSDLSVGGDATVGGGITVTGLTTTSGLVLAAGVTVSEISNDTTLSGSSATALVTENAVKNYVDDKFLEETPVFYNVALVRQSARVWTYGSGFTEVPDAVQVYFNGVFQKGSDSEYYTAAINGGALEITFAFDTYTDDWASVTYGTYAGALEAPSGGASTLLELTDTPSSFDDGKYLQSTASGTVWAAASGGGLSAWSVVTSNGTTASDGDRYMLDSTGGAFTITLPASPSMGDEVTFLDAGGDASTYNITVGRNGEPIMGSASDFVIDTDNASFSLVYYNGTRGWVLAD